jgi:ubiquinone/menaquinone biosynthesis C-methylase UbiE
MDSRGKFARVYDSELRENLLALLQKFLKKSLSKEKIEKILRVEFSDREILRKFCEIMTSSKAQKVDKINEFRAKTRLKETWKMLQGLYEKDIKIAARSGSAYLDLGSGDCTISRVVGYDFGFSGLNINAVDIDDFSISAEEQRVNFSQINGKYLPYPDNTFVFVTAFQVLHHVSYLEKMLSELTRTMIDGGILLIREQNSISNLHSDLFDIEHMMYDIVMRRTQNYDEFVSTYYANFHSRHEWDSILEKNDFQLIRIGHISKRNPTNYYYAVYKLRKFSQEKNGFVTGKCEKLG